MGKQPDRRTYAVKIDCQAFEVHTPSISGKELLALAGKRPCSHELFQEVSHCENDVIEPEHVVDLTQPGRERFRTAHKETVAVSINGERFHIKRGETTVDAILRLVGQSSEAYMLLQEKDGPPTPLPPNLPVVIEGCEVFYTQVHSGASS